MPSAPNPSSVLGVLVSVNPASGATRRWGITGTDALWLGRMLVAEDGWYTSNPEKGYAAGRAMVSMILRRLAVVFARGSYTSTTHLLRGDPSGGNPQGWSSPLRFTQGSESSSSAQTRAWGDIPDYYQRAVLDTVTGRVALTAPSVVDAAEGSACSGPGTAAWTTNACFTERRIAEHGGDWRRELPGLTKSWLVSTSASRRWPEENVYIAGGARAHSPLGERVEQLLMPLAVLGAVAALAAFAHARWSR